MQEAYLDWNDPVYFQILTDNRMNPGVHPDMYQFGVLPPACCLKENISISHLRPPVAMVINALGVSYYTNI